jgi:hypothetical protein
METPSGNVRETLEAHDSGNEGLLSGAVIRDKVRCVDGVPSVRDLVARLRNLSYLESKEVSL